MRKTVGDIPAYIDEIESGRLNVCRGYILNRRQQIVREVIEAMMCNYYISWSEIARRLSLTPKEVKAAVNYDEEHLRKMAADGIIDYTPDAISMTSEGSPFVRNVVAILDPLMLNTTKKFSKPI